ncbi:MAG: YkgJ family cysteine cluster protein [Methanomassiliicoccales archaeon]|nr:YkgJ family cysteine cluster protein [Methanomassiliicoccales archaeon]
MARYIRKGICNRCGDCCKPRFEIDEEARKFYAENGLPENGQCQFLALIGGEWTCTIYSRRPPFCAAFPWHPDQLKGLPRCSYYFVIEDQD